MDRAFWSHVRREGECWIYDGADNGNGYGAVARRRGGRQVHTTAHRYLWVVLLKRPVPPGYVLDHFVCENRRCVRPSHVEPVTPRHNTLRDGSRSPSAVNARKVLCLNGHDAWVVRRSGKRDCRICHADRQRERKRRLRLVPAA